MRRTLATLTAAALALATLALPAVADGGVEDAALVPPDGQSAVKVADEIMMDGTVPADATDVTATLHAVTLGGAVIDSFDVTSALEITGGDVGGSFVLSSLYVPGYEEQTCRALTSAAGYTLELATGSGSDTSDRLDLDLIDPFLLGYSLVGTSTVVVRFNEDVADPEGDSALDWEVEQQRTVRSVDGVGDERTLTLTFPVDADATPEIRYRPQPSVIPQVPNQVYLDGAGNDLCAFDRFALAADRVPPPVPSIDTVDGGEVTYESEDEAVPVLGDDPTPTVEISDTVAGSVVELYLDDGDSRFEAEQDTLVGEADGQDGTTSVSSTASLSDGVHRFYARARDRAECDPNDSDSDECPNPSGRSQEALYDLDTVAPEVGTVLSRAATISVPFTEPVTGTDDAGQWTVDNGAGAAVTIDAVSGSGDRRSLEFSGGPLVPGATLTWTAPGDGAYADEHGNQLVEFTAPIGVADQILLDVVPADGDEGDPPAVPLDPPVLTYTLRLAEPVPTGESVTADYTTMEPTEDAATAGTDYTATSGTAAFGPGDQEVVVEVPIEPDELDEFDEVVLLRVDDVSGAQLPDDATSLDTPATILDDDPQVTVAFTSDSEAVAVDEGDGVTLTVELDTASGKPVEVDWSTATDGDADQTDVAAQSGRAVIAAGDTTASFTVETLQDQVDEGDETFSVALTDPVNATLADDRVTDATVTIADDDLPVPTLTVEPGSVSEDAALLPLLTNPQLTFTFRLDPAPEQPLEVAWTTDDDGTATAGQDFTGRSGTVRFEAGETEQTVDIEVLDDELDEFDETVALRVADPAGAQLEGGGEQLVVLGEVLDDDPLVSVSLGDDVEATEGDSVSLGVALDTASGKDVTVRYATADGTATAGQDYRSTSGELTIAAGDTEGSIALQTLDDATDESDEQLTVSIEVVDDDTATLGDAEATVTVLDDDVVTAPPGTVVLSLTGGSVEEGDPVFPVGAVPGNEVPFTITLSEAADEDVTVRYETRTGTADADDDYQPVTDGSVVIPAGDTSAEVTVEVVPDQLDEPDETVVLATTSASGAQVPNGELSRDGNILDDDPLAQLRVGDATVIEGDVAAVEVSLDTASGRDVTVDYALVDGTATGADHDGSAGTLRFPAGTTTRTVAVPTVDDDEAEAIEQLTVELADPSGAGIEDGSGTVTIVDNDGGVPGLPGLPGLPGVPATVGAEDTATAEPASGSRVVEVPIRLTAASDSDVTVSWQTQDFTASAGEDYTEAGGQVRIPAGATTVRVPVTVFADAESEPSETFLVVLTSAEGALITGPVARVTIDDTAPASDGDDGGNGDDGGDGQSPGGSGDPAGAPDAGDDQLPATGGGAAALVTVALAAAAALRRRRS